MYRCNTKTPLHINLELETDENINYRHVIYTLENFQLVLMSIPPLENIPMEKHQHTTQFIRVESGKGIAVINGSSYQLSDGIAICIPPNTYHEILNISDTEPLKLYSIYVPPEHKHGLIEKYKQE